MTKLALPSFQGPKYYPMSYPSIPKDELLENQQLQKIVLELASILEVRGLFHEHGDLVD